MSWRVVTNSLCPQRYDKKPSVGIITHGVGVIPAHSAGTLLCHRPNANFDNIGKNVFLSSPRTADSNDVKLMQEIGRPGKSNTAPCKESVLQWICGREELVCSQWNCWLETDLARNNMSCCFASMSCHSSKLLYLWVPLFFY